EDKFIAGLDKLGFDSGISFKGVIDAVFTDGNDYLIVDWKTSRDDKQGSKHRQQLEAYKRLFSMQKGIEPERISVAIGYAGLRGAVNPTSIGYKLDEKQPVKKSFETFSKRVNKFLEWKNDTDAFFRALKEEKVDTPLWKAVVEEWGG
ncbi:MAG: PD-(D/E)XK nuclease family protein, partial [Candidatus Woesearchaeota archaeon]